MKRHALLFLSIYFVINNVIIINAVEELLKKNANELNEALENLLKTRVKIKKIFLSVQNIHIPSGLVYQTEQKKLLFVKHDSRNESEIKFRGEFEGLKTIRDTYNIFVPRPIAIGHTAKSDQHFIVMDYLKMIPFKKVHFVDLGNRLAELHLTNSHRNEPHVKKFGFHVDTSNGHISQNNTWTDDWITFFIENRMGHQIELLRSKITENPDKKKILEDCWPKLKPIIPKFFQGIRVQPSLLHGDFKLKNLALWDSRPVIFDPATFYGHNEYDIASTTLFGGFNDKFYSAYFRRIHKSVGIENRLSLYHLFYYLNSWQNHGGDFLKLAVMKCMNLLEFK